MRQALLGCIAAAIISGISHVQAGGFAELSWSDAICPAGKCESRNGSLLTVVAARIGEVTPAYPALPAAQQLYSTKAATYLEPDEPIAVFPNVAMTDSFGNAIEPRRLMAVTSDGLYAFVLRADLDWPKSKTEVFDIISELERKQLVIPARILSPGDSGNTDFSDTEGYIFDVNACDAEVTRQISNEVVLEGGVGLGFAEAYISIGRAGSMTTRYPQGQKIFSYTLVSPASKDRVRITRNVACGGIPRPGPTYQYTVEFNDDVFNLDMRMWSGLIPIKDGRPIISCYVHFVILRSLIAEEYDIAPQFLPPVLGIVARWSKFNSFDRCEFTPTRL